MHTARFWYPMNGDFVKLSIYHLQPVTHVSGGWDEEGHSYTERRFSYHNGVVTIEAYTSACDCDGPLETWATYKADINSKHEVRLVDVPLLTWKRIDGRQRDHYAEAMGY